MSETHNSLLEELAARYCDVMGNDRGSCLGYVRRMLRFFELLRAALLDELDVIAGFFHDLDIWTDRTNDYLPPSVREAYAYLEEAGRGDRWRK